MLAKVLNVTDGASVLEALVARDRGQQGPVSVLVNNAGITPKTTS